MITTGSIIWRVVFTAITLALYGFINGVIYPVTTIAAGRVAGSQFENDDVTSVISTYGVNFIGSIGWPALLLALILLGIWWRVISEGWRWLIAPAAMLMFIIPQPAEAYYEKTDWPEIYFILPNESAFWIPDTGANKESQAQFMSEVYLEANKIAAKRFQVPHVQLPKSSWTMDFYVPAGRLIIVDRSPYTREWSADASRGTGAADESFKCQSKDGLDVTVGVAISAAVMEKDAARFLYRFGVNPPTGDRNTEAVKFQSVYHGKSLTQVMDTVIKGKIQALICTKFSPRSLDLINAEAGTIVSEAEKEVEKYLIDTFGITLDYLGWGDTFSFSPVVQTAIDDRYAADKIASVVPVLQQAAELRIKQATADAIRTFGEGVKAHGLPANLLALPADGLGALGGAAGIAAAIQQQPAARPAPAAPARAPAPAPAQ